MKIRPGQPEWTTVDSHLDRLLALPEAEWEPYLSGLRDVSGDVMQTLRELMSAHRETQEKAFLEHGILESPDRAHAGTIVGPYTISSLIGRGGMGEVWLAQRSDGRFEGRFAVKFLDSYTASPAALDRFRREGRLLARLTHAHIARLIDAGVNAAGRPYLILEYVPGQRIDEYCNSRSLGVQARIRLLLDVLDALVHAHTNLVIHRDIKPTNILVTPAGEVKLLDFGVAKLLSPESGAQDDAPLTRVEDSAFTPEFAAPEQILGEPPSTATDVYQVGVLMFALLANRLPMTLHGATRAERIRSALDHEPARLSEVAPSGVRGLLRGDLDAIVSKALRKLPQERYATASALADDLRRYLGNEPVAARANLLGYRLRKFVQRYRAAVLGSSAAVIALIATTAFALSQMRAAQLQRDQLREQAKRAEKQAELVTLMMSTVGNRPTTAEQLLDEGRSLVSEHYTGDPGFRASALLNLAARYGDLGLTQKQLALAQQAHDIALAQNDLPLLARSDCSLSGSQIDLGHVGRAAALVAEGRAYLDRVPRPDPLYIEDCMEADADVVDAQGHPAQATEKAEKALALLEQADETHDVRYPELLGRIADYYKEAGNTRKGFEYVSRALTAEERNGLGDTDEAMTAIHNVASSLVGFGEVKEACRREQDLVNRLQSTGRTIITAMSVLYGTCLLREGNVADALTWYEHGLAAAKAEGDAMLQMYAGSQRALALIALKRFADASQQLDGVEALGAAHGLSNSMQGTRASLARAELLLAEQHPDAAEDTLRPVLQVVRDPKGGQGVLLPRSLLAAARIAFAQRKYAEAAHLADEALRDDEKRARDPAMSADVGEAALLLAKCESALGNKSESQRAAQQATVSLSASLGPDNVLTRDARALQ